ncbi:DUF2505 domain-containing protein [Mycobacterium sp. 1274756.6]|uniref:DUF2505 domain-containing protein n=1 Tax=Mycobacterium sp. 1274756.6 TaxID=1834076 RepID=UPI000800FDC3|nr:DUF2505 domain-containing protein [Mycobacterium sp. 1274756.6]OBJ73056.1 hypothetical protein A5643_04485 [Mycobacterium sp. 1274756.6]
MPRSFDLSADYPVAVDEVFAAFGDRQYWLARLAESGADVATLDALTVADDGTVDVSATQSLARWRLPALAAQFHRGDLDVVRRETWHPVQAGVSRGEVDAEVRGAPASLCSKARLTPLPTGSRLSVSATVRVNVPLVGGKLESFIANALGDLLTAEQRFTAAWLAERR